MALLADVCPVGVQGDGRTCGHSVVSRPVSNEDVMIANRARVPHDVPARVSTSVTDTVEGVDRAVLDMTSEPPGTIERG